jgi:hypothetical protein
MASFEQVPVTAAAFVVVTALLSGCIAYDATRATMDAGTTLVGTGISVVTDTGSLVLLPVGHSDANKAR